MYETWKWICFIKFSMILYTSAGARRRTPSSKNIYISLSAQIPNIKSKISSYIACIKQRHTVRFSPPKHFFGSFQRVCLVQSICIYISTMHSFSSITSITNPKEKKKKKKLPAFLFEVKTCICGCYTDIYITWKIFQFPFT